MGFHLNGDESMALGAAFMAANLSSDIRVKPLWLSDGYEYSFKLCIESTGNDETTAINKTIVLFSKRVALLCLIILIRHLLEVKKQLHLNPRIILNFQFI